jgi:hypothetical protein
MGEIKDTYNIAGNPERIRPPGSHKHKWEDNIKMDLSMV